MNIKNVLDRLLAGGIEMGWVSDKEAGQLSMKLAALSGTLNGSGIASRSDAQLVKEAAEFIAQRAASLEEVRMSAHEAGYLAAMADVDAQRAGSVEVQSAGYLYGNSYFEEGSPRLTDEIRKLGRPLYTAPAPASTSADLLHAEIERLHHAIEVKGRENKMLLDQIDRIIDSVQPDSGRDAARLDFMIANDAFIVKVADKSTFLGYQLMTQNEDEEYIELSGEAEVFKTERAAIDMAMEIAAMAAQQGEKGGA